jgi:signal transduction histidine kinase
MGATGAESGVGRRGAPKGVGEVAGERVTPTQPSSWELQPLIGGLCHFLAHDLSNAISALTITLDLLAAQQDLPDKSRDLVRRCLSVEGRMRALVDALGTLGGARLRPQPLKLQAQLETILRQLKLRERFQVEVELVGLRDGDCATPAPNLIELCLRLLLRNAAEATPSRARLGVRAEQQSGTLRLTVWDEGHGVPPELRDKLFRQVFSTKAGNGVALLLVRAAVEGSLHGRVGYAPNHPSGSRFSLELPA